MSYVRVFKLNGIIQSSLFASGWLRDAQEQRP